MNSIILKPQKDKAIRHRHPWVFSGAIEKVIGFPGNGETIQILDSRNQFLALGSYSPNSQIRSRVWTFRKEAIDQQFFRQRIQNSIDRRNKFRQECDDSAWRIVHGESDLMPGLIVDQYNGIMVVQFLSSGVEYYRKDILAALKETTGIDCIYERSDVDVRRLEGLSERSGLISGDTPKELIITEDNKKFLVQIATGQKTGFYLDQRVNRKIVAGYCAQKEVLNVFSYTGAFSVYAAANNAAHVVSVDSSSPALEVARRNFILNDLDVNSAEWIVEDAFQYLRKLRTQGRQFDVIILDPPKFAVTAKQVEKAARGYKDINMLAFQLLRPGGILATFSCSGGLSEALFQKIVADAALDGGVDAVILERLQQGPDHPIGLNFPEGAYLKGLICVRD